MDQLRAGLVLGHRFRLVEPVRAGGGRGVWRAVDEAAGHEVAVKALGIRAAWSVAERARLRIAFSTVSAASGPGIARVHEHGELALPGGMALPYLVRELVSGRSLEERLADGPAPVDEALAVVARVADALAAAHRSGVVHGNLVPANVILGPNGVTVTDFGLWALRDHLAGANFQSVLSYAAPERLSGEPASPAADMYSLGVLFVACLSGIAAGGTAGASPVMDPDEAVAPSLASLWAACLGANPRERPSAAHAAFMSRQVLAALPAALSGHAGQPAADASTAPASTAPAGTAPPSTAPGGAASPGAPVPSFPDGDRAGAPAPPGQPAHSGQPAHPGRPRRGRGVRPRDSRPGRGSRIRPGRGGLVALGIVAGITAAVAMLTQFLASPSAQTTGASATPSAGVHAGQRPSPLTSAGRAAPSAEATTSVLASASPPPLQVLNQIRATIRHGVSDGQIRQDVAVDLNNLLQPIQADLTSGDTAPVPQLVAGLKAKLATRLAEGAITQAADNGLSRELSALAKSTTHG